MNLSSMAEQLAFVRNASVKGIKMLIGPAGVMCTCCGKSKQYEGWNPLKVCTGCFNSIPWIKDIRCPVCGRGEDCPDCSRREQRYLAMNRSAVRYDDGMRELLARYKYRGDERLQQLLGRMLVHAYRQYVPLPRKRPVFDCITYVPISEDRYAERGFNQARQMAGVLAEQVRLPVVSLLTRQRHTDKQSQVSREERFANLQGAFAVVPGSLARLQAQAGREKLRILLVDDVYTTGSTMNRCAFELRRELPATQVYGLCWAR